MAKDEGSLHAGHRKRLRQRWQETGLEGFNDINALELLLFYVLPRQDTNPVAHRLLDTFGSLAGVLEASADQLQTVDGIGEAAAQFFPILRAVQERAAMEKWLQEQRVRQLRTPEDLYQFFLPFFAEKQRETAYLLCLSVDGRPQGCEKIQEGSVSAVGFPSRRAVELALKQNAQLCVMAHNHPISLARPSQEDLATTKTLQTALETIGVVLLDHIILGRRDWCSLAREGYLQQYWE